MVVPESVVYFALKVAISKLSLCLISRLEEGRQHEKSSLLLLGSGDGKCHSRRQTLSLLSSSCSPINAWILKSVCCKDFILVLLESVLEWNITTEVLQTRERGAATASQQFHP